MFSIKSRYLLSAVLAIYSFINILLVEAFDYYPIKTNKWIIFLLFLALSLAIWEGNRYIENWIAKKNIETFWKKSAYHFIGSIIFTLVVTFIFGGLAAKFTLNTDLKEWILPFKLLLTLTFRINLFLNTINIIFLYHNQLEKSYQELENYKRISTQAQLQSLKNQINPHFLFNNLSVLSALIPKDVNASLEFVKQFSKVYRYVLNSNDKELMELKDELFFINSYAYLLKTRFGNGLEIKFNINQQNLSAYILPISLQMLVENAIKHNIISKNKPLIVEIESLDEHFITVKNNIEPKIIDPLESTKIGLSNIIKRYAFLGKNNVEIINDTKSFTVKLPLIYLNH
jgi:two-component system LytT family sensor kinase